MNFRSSRVFVGHSIKSMVCATASIRRPDLISKLVTLCATLGYIFYNVCFNIDALYSSA